jgi:hypothetical protein
VSNGDYIIDDYINAINNGVTSSDLYGTMARIDTSNTFIMDVKVEKVFNASDFNYTLGNFWTSMDISGTYATPSFNIDLSNNTGPYTITSDNSLCFIITPNDDTPISSDFKTYVYLTEASSITIDELIESMNIALNSQTTDFVLQGYTTISDNVLNVQVIIVDRLTTGDFSVEFIDNSNTWENYLYVTENVQIDLSGHVIASIPGSQPVDNTTILITTKNNKLSFCPDNNYPNNTLNLEITPSIYTLYTLLVEINAKLEVATTTRGENIATGSRFYIEEKNGKYYTSMYININQVYNSQDYSIVFYETPEGCFSDNTKAYNAGLSTLGRTLGYSNVSYNLLDYPIENNVVSLYSEAPVVLQTNQYFILTLDDFTNSSKNTSLVTSTPPETKQQLPSYAKDSLRKFYVDTEDGCDTVVSIMKKNGQIMTSKELLSSQTILNTLSSENTSSQFDSGAFSNQLNQTNVKNVLSVIPIY